MLSRETRIRVKSITGRLRNCQDVSLEERIYLTKLSKVSSVVSLCLYSALAREAHAIDEDIA